MDFCIDGVLMPGQNAVPALLEYKQVIAPVKITKVAGSRTKVRLESL